MPSQSAVFDIPQPVVNEIFPDAFGQDMTGYSVLSYFYDHLQPKRDFTEQQYILRKHSTILDDDRTITRLLEAKPEPGLLMAYPLQPLPQAVDVERLLNSSRSFLNYFDHPIILEIYELSENKRDEYEEGVVAKSKSVSYAIIFVESILKRCKMIPEVDLHNDGEVSLTWRSNRGIINIAFGEDGTATYAAYFPMNKETYKGRFRVSSAIPEFILNIIGQIENSNDWR